jgi:RNA polymerase sigma-70 factor (ECF subfamily)
MMAKMARLGREFERGIVLRLDTPAMGTEHDGTVSLEEHVSQLYISLRLPLFRYLLCFNLSPDDAEEMIQETFLVLHRRLHAGKRPDNLRGWVYRVAHNLALNLGKSRRYLRDASPEDWAAIAESVSDPAPNREQVLLERERMLRLHQVMSTLPEQQRHCLYLRVEGFRYREIAQILGVTVAAVSGALRLAMEKLNRSQA